MTASRKVQAPAKGTGATMKRLCSGWFLALIFVVAGTLVPDSALAQSQQRPEEQPAGNPAEPAKASGVVPPGVKLVPDMPVAGKPGVFEFPTAATKTLPNGLKVFVVTNHSEPAVAVRLVILSAGTIKDPAGMPGVAQMTASLLTQGTEKRSAQQIAEEIDFVGGSLNASATKDVTALTLDIVKKDLNTGLDLMSDVLLHPVFKADEIDRQRQQLLSNLQVQYSDPDYLASLVLARVVYSGSPYGFPSEGTPATVEKFQRDLFVKFRDENYAPNQSLLAFAGDVTPEQAFAVAEKYFGDWKQLDVAANPPPSPVALSGQHIWLIDKPDAVQTQIRVGKLSINRADPDYLPLSVTNHIFGGSYNSRLNTEVRIKSGLTYGANSSVAPHRYTGSLSVDTYTRTEQTIPALKLVMNMLSRMSSGDVTPKEMDFARDYLAGVYPIASETAEQVADRVLMVAMYGLPADYNRTYPEKIRGTSIDEVRAMSKKYFGTANLDIVLAGNVSAFRDEVKKEYPSAQFTEIAATDLDTLSDDLRVPKQAAAAATPESLAQGKQILLAAAKAAGGDALKQVTTLSIMESGKIHAPNGDHDLHVKWQVVYPDRSYGEVDLGGTKVLQVCDSKSSWLQFPDSVHDTTDEIAEFKRGILLFGGGWGFYREVLAGNITGQAIGEETIDGLKTQGVAADGAFGSLKLYFDESTHLLTAARYQSAAEQGFNNNEQRWSGYKALDGKQFAYATVTYRNGVKFFESEIQNVQLNPKVDNTLFAKPAGAAN
jgi:zinc protease